MSERLGVYLLRVNVCTNRHSAEDGYMVGRVEIANCTQLLKPAVESDRTEYKQ